MVIAWDKKLEIGDQTIDTQHQQLVETFNALMNACAAGQGRDELENALNFLCEYTVKHFAEEEALQLQINYPEFSKHKQLHEDFKVRVTNLANQFKQEGPSFSILARLNIDVGDWLLKHIMHEDKKFAPYINSHATDM